MKITVTENSHWKGPVLHLRVMEEGEPGFPNWLLELAQTDESWMGFHHLLDHARHVGDIAVGEPYDGRDFEFAALVEFCSKHGLKFHVTGKSHHYPSATFRLVIWRPEDAAKVDHVRYFAEQVTSKQTLFVANAVTPE